MFGEAENMEKGKMGEKCSSPRSLTLVFKQKHLHPVQREGLPEAVRHRVLLLLENLGDLNQKRDTLGPHLFLIILSSHL